MHARAVLAVDRLGHERRVHVVAGRDGLDDPAERGQVVGARERVRVAEVDLVLTDRDLVMRGLEIEAHRREGVLDVAAGVLAEIERADVEVARDVVRIDRRIAVAVAAEEEELGLRAALHLEALGLGVREHLLELHARVACERRAVRIGDVADDARDLAGLASAPRQHRERARVGWKYMSDCSMRLKPRIDEPSNMSSLLSALSSSSTGIETFRRCPYSSVKISRTNLTSCSRHFSISSRLSTAGPSSYSG